MVICFCLNNLGALGLGAGLVSLIKHCSDSSKLQFYFLCSLVDNDIKKQIEKLLTDINFDGKRVFIDFDAYKEFGKYRPLQKDWTTYGRLLIPDLVNEKVVLYLDTDMVTETDVTGIFNINTENFVIGAISSTPIQYALEHKFFCNTLKIDPALQVFNAGVLLINIAEWRKQHIKTRLLAIGDRYPDELLSADQTLLNAFFAGNFLQLPLKYNVQWYPKQPPPVNNDAIYHFVGSPKPWDFFARWVHSGYKKWKQYNPDSWTNDVLGRHKVQQLKRLWAIKRSYFKLLLKK